MLVVLQVWEGRPFRAAGTVSQVQKKDLCHVCGLNRRSCTVCAFDIAELCQVLKSFLIDRDFFFFYSIHQNQGLFFLPLKCYNRCN